LNPKKTPALRASLGGRGPSSLKMHKNVSERERERERERELQMLWLASTFKDA
jgi:hypothetical protein